ncbi:MAG: hypothetical protein A4E57_04722 [Syntrophorhabdaceae bacterium PtaU1.Bin034]|nr:MAG: hypothetical protein A4E57_04722 [Syntrophorhabdaceae bacterium PtaU1.Bin034]
MFISLASAHVEKGIDKCTSYHDAAAPADGLPAFRRLTSESTACKMAVNIQYQSNSHDAPPHNTYFLLSPSLLLAEGVTEALKACGAVTVWQACLYNHQFIFFHDSRFHCMLQLFFRGDPHADSAGSGIVEHFR